MLTSFISVLTEKMVVIVCCSMGGKSEDGDDSSNVEYCNSVLC